MKIFKRILRILSSIAILAGLVLMATAYYPNRSFIQYLLGLINEAHLTHALNMFLVGLGLIFAAIIVFGLTFRLREKTKPVVEQPTKPAEVQYEEEDEEEYSHDPLV
ncbi:MAG: hypothetical protein IKE51_02185 [Solobacterium sp.]|nr:hypothetical protein [Solobacterium sp.]